MQVFDIHPEARREFADDTYWYAERSAEAAVRFDATVILSLEQIVDAPLRYPPYLHGARKFTVRGFPYVIVYRVVDSAPQFLAIAHAARRPGYWKSRTTP